MGSPTGRGEVGKCHKRGEGASGVCVLGGAGQRAGRTRRPPSPSPAAPCHGGQGGALHTQEINSETPPPCAHRHTPAGGDGERAGGGRQRRAALSRAERRRDAPGTAAASPPQSSVILPAAAAWPPDSRRSSSPTRPPSRQARLNHGASSGEQIPAGQKDWQWFVWRHLPGSQHCDW